MTTDFNPSAAADFDFLVGKWQVQHRRLKARLANCDTWDEFVGRSQMSKHLDGRVNLDDNVLELPAGPYCAVTLRSFDPATKTWAIWWLDGRHPHQLDAPMIGSFLDGVGTFYADDTVDGKAIRVRFLWTDISATSCRWQQAFSDDGGTHWETNWVMEFARVA